MDAQKVDRKIKEDFLFFIHLIWEHLNLPKPTNLQNNIALSLVTAPKRYIIEAFRGCGKSFITSAFVIWMLYRDPNLKFMVVSASKERADAFSSFSKRLIAEVPWLAHLRAKPGQRDSLIAFDVGPAGVDHSPSVKSVGITGTLTGSRANFIIADDIEVPNNSFTQTARDKLAELVKEFDAILKPFDPRIMAFEPKVIYLGTPQCEMSLYNTLSEERGYETRIWTAQFPENPSVYKGKLANFITDALAKNPKLAGKPTDPARFTYEDLMERKASYGKAGYALQFMLDTSLSDADKYPLKLVDLIVTECSMKKAPAEYSLMRHRDYRIEELPAVGLTGDYYFRPDWTSDSRLEYQSKILVIDPSGRGADETAYCVLKLLNGYIHLCEVGGFREGYSDNTLTNLAKTAKNHQVNQIVVESNFGDGMFKQLLKPFLVRLYPCSIEEVRSVGQKERRVIETLEPVMMQHRLVVDPSVIEADYEGTKNSPQYSLFYQMTRITQEKGCLAHDDRLDCLAIGVAFYQNQLDVDANRMEVERKAEELQKLLDDSAAFFSPGAQVVATFENGQLSTWEPQRLEIAGF